MGKRLNYLGKPPEKGVEVLLLATYVEFIGNRTGSSSRLYVSSILVATTIFVH